MQSRNDIFQKFVEKNPSFSNPEGHHRKLADWHWDTKLRADVDFGRKNFEEALNECARYALDQLPLERKSETLTDYDQTIQAMAIARNVPPPPSTNYKEEPPQRCCENLRAARRAYN